MGAGQREDDAVNTYRATPSSLSQVSDMPRRGNESIHEWLKRDLP